VRFIRGNTVGWYRFETKFKKNNNNNNKEEKKNGKYHSYNKPFQQSLILHNL